MFGVAVRRVYLQRLLPAVFLKIGDCLRMPVFRQHEILLMQTRERAVVLAGHHYVENHNPRIRVEDLAVRCRPGVRFGFAGAQKGGWPSRLIEAQALRPSRSAEALDYPLDFTLRRLPNSG